MDIRNDPSVYSGEHGREMPDIIPTRQSFQRQILRFGASAACLFFQKADLPRQPFVCA
jgi:hypothetical protein